MDLADVSSDDDIDIKHESVTNYWVVSQEDTPISFTVLPCVWKHESRAAEREVYLRGTSDNGMSLYLRVFSWNLELDSDSKPVFYLKTDKYWIKLLKPRKSYEDTIRSILTVVSILNYVLLKPEASEKAAWDHVKELFPSWELEPNRHDVSSHIDVIQHILSLNPRFTTSRALQTMDVGLSRKALQSATREVDCQNRRKRMRDSENDNDEAEMDCRSKKISLEGGSKFDDEKDSEIDADVDEVADLSEAVCCICDNGGEVTGCDGPCMRSFHVHKDASGAHDSSCETLGFSKSLVQKMDKFYCPNCQAKEHQCYACGELGPSDETVDSTEKVYVCDAAMCGRFYHPRCVAQYILRDKNESEKASLADSIKDGKGFVCPMHKCLKCGKGETKEKRDFQFGVCRRCPRVWHRKCFPSYILFSEQIDDDSELKGKVARAWDGLLQDQILIYCKRHTIIASLGTPERTHVKFPASFSSASQEASEKKKSHLEGEHVKLSRVNSSKTMDHEGSKSMVGKAKDSFESISAKQKMDGSRLKQPARWMAPEDGWLQVKSDVMSASGKVKRMGDSSSKPSVSTTNVVSRATRSLVDNIIRKAKERVTFESVINKHEAPMNYRNGYAKNIDRKHSLARIESITRGMRKALETLDNGGSVEDAKTKCAPDLIKYLELCKNDLRVYLSPLLYGARYTSYGRHFTKVEKLEQIVERLHWYVNSNDMIVDFCCGANDFSLLMKSKLEQEGKQCYYRNFDAIQAKNDFQFSKRDWFTVKTDELIDGNRLIMGLNPPFGVKAALANQFIDHALKFRPKILVLIVPREAKRLDQRHEKYDLIWDDPELLEGKSFYLPGSVDIWENQLSDWNNVAPPLYLWSRTDWTARHRNVALQVGHVTSQTSTRYANSNNSNRVSIVNVESRGKKQEVEGWRRGEACETTTTSASRKGEWERSEKVLQGNEEKKKKQEEVVGKRSEKLQGNEEKKQGKFLGGEEASSKGNRGGSSGEQQQKQQHGRIEGNSSSSISVAAARSLIERRGGDRFSENLAAAAFLQHPQQGRIMYGSSPTATTTTTIIAPLAMGGREPARATSTVHGFNDEEKKAVPLPLRHVQQHRPPPPPPYRRSLGGWIED